MKRVQVAKELAQKEERQRRTALKINVEARLEREKEPKLPKPKKMRGRSKEKAKSAKQELGEALVLAAEVFSEKKNKNKGPREEISEARAKANEYFGEEEKTQPAERDYVETYNRRIRALKYVPTKNKKTIIENDKKGRIRFKRRVIEYERPHFKAKISDDKTRRAVVLKEMITVAWVQFGFKREFVNQCIRKPDQWLFVPASDSRSDKSPDTSLQAVKI